MSYNIRYFYFMKNSYATLYHCVRTEYILWLKARSAVREDTSVARERHGKHVPAAADP
jgi:hypothetical protein